LKNSLGKQRTQQSNSGMAVVLQGNMIIGRSMGNGLTLTAKGKGRRETPQSTDGFVGVQ
jgi:hypothetical protein